MGVLERLLRAYPDLSKSQARLADYILASYQEAAFLTATDLAAKLQLNEATVVRFAQRVGFAGYPALLDGLRELVRDELKGREASEASHVGGAFYGMLHAQVEALQRAETRLPPTLMREALALLRQARPRVCGGAGISASLAQLFAELARFVGLKATVAAADALGLALSLADLDEGCAMVAVAAGPPSDETANALRYARDHGARTLAFTWSLTSPVAQAADLAVLCAATEVSPMTSIGVMAGLIDAVLQTLAAENVEGVQARLERYVQARDYLLARRRR